MQHPGEAAMPAPPHVGIAVADLGERILDTLQRRDLVVGVELLRCGRGLGCRGGRVDRRLPLPVLAPPPG